MLRKVKTVKIMTMEIMDQTIHMVRATVMEKDMRIMATIVNMEITMTMITGTMRTMGTGTPTTPRTTLPPWQPARPISPVPRLATWSADSLLKNSLLSYLTLR